MKFDIHFEWLDGEGSVFKDCTLDIEPSHSDRADYVIKRKGEAVAVVPIYGVRCIRLVPVQ